LLSCAPLSKWPDTTPGGQGSARAAVGSGSPRRLALSEARNPIWRPSWRRFTGRNLIAGPEHVNLALNSSPVRKIPMEAIGRILARQKGGLEPGLTHAAVRLESRMSKSHVWFCLRSGAARLLRPVLSHPLDFTKAAMASLHEPVLVAEVVDWLLPREREGAAVVMTIVDGTVGGGGHAVALARRMGPSGRVIGLDRDPAMLALAREAVSAASETLGYTLPVTLVHARYREMRGVLDDLGIIHVEGILLDLGLSSDQLAAADRGFSFTVDGPLDMRFDPNEPGPTAAELVKRLPEADLAQLFFDFGEERFSRRISRRIVEARRNRPIQTAGELAELVRRSVPPKARHGPIDPATRVFQALRIAVNRELEELDAALECIPNLLAPRGRAAIISFHSLEDRRVKWAFKSNQYLRVLTKKPVTATAQEVAGNPRARSAKLRVVERCMNPTSSSGRQ
jgi:16S rRNA (cytosine1402-N4)-methyltransferase